MIPQQIRSKIESDLSLKITNSTQLSGGSISNVLMLETSRGEKYLLKYLYNAPSRFYSAEAHGLDLIRSVEQVLAPKAITYLDSQVPDSFSFILLEWIESDGFVAEEHLAKSLAILHQNTTSKFGLTDDNFIGLSQQINSTHSDWGEFFFSCRILPQLHSGLKLGWLSQELYEQFSQFESEFKYCLNQCQDNPSLLHGDLWSGNVLYANGFAYLIDPAAYFGVREADIAMTELFGGFSDTFYKHYNELFPLSSDYNDRKSLLNLYHIMNHANLFGGSYISQSVHCLTKIISRWI